MRVVALLCALTGCDQLFNIDHVPRSDARGSDGAIDTPIDGPFTLDDCPIDYIEELHPGSVYRISRGAAAWTHHDACASDAPGLTHLAVIETVDEHAAVQARRAQVDGTWYVGLVQLRSALTAEQGIWLSGDPVLPVWSGGEPNDVDLSESDHWEQFAVLHPGLPALVDYDGAVTFDALCECDGRGITAQAHAAVDSNRK